MSAELADPDPRAAALPTIALLRSASLASAVQAELERQIVEGELAPGARLGEMALAARFGVSRGPLREAFRMLEEAGLVRTEKNRGVFVRDLPVDEAAEIFDLRAAMEELVGRRLAERIGAAELKELRGRVDAMDKLAKADDAHAYHLANLRFHDRLVEMAGNRKLSAIYRRLINELSLFRRLALEPDGGRGALAASAAAHRAIVRAVASGDPEVAGRALFDHVVASKARALARHAAEASAVTATATGGGDARR